MITWHILDVCEYVYLSEDFFKYYISRWYSKVDSYLNIESITDSKEYTLKCCLWAYSFHYHTLCRANFSLTVILSPFWQKAGGHQLITVANSIHLISATSAVSPSLLFPPSVKTVFSWLRNQLELHRRTLCSKLLNCSHDW